MLWQEIKIFIDESDEVLMDDDLDDVDTVDALIALEETLPELPKGAVWRVIT